LFVVLSCVGGVLGAATLRLAHTAARYDSEVELAQTKGIGEQAGPNPEIPRMTAKAEIAEALAIGEVDLSEAMSLVRSLYDGEPPFLEPMRADYPFASDDELVARNLINAVGPYLWKRPKELAARVAELEAELDCLRVKS
jgi:hypothetical protein